VWSALPEASAHTFVLYVPAGEPRVAPLAGPGAAVRMETREVGGGSGTWWEQVRLAWAVRHDRPDVLFAPAYTAPLLAGVPVVLTLHDLSFLAKPEWFPLRMRVRRRMLSSLSARRASCVLTDSEFSRGEIVGRIGIPAARVRVVPLGLTAPGGDRGRRHGAAAGPLILFVGSVFNRRHLPELIQAVARVAERHPAVRLEIVGDNRTHPPQDLASIAATAGIADRTACRSYVPDEVLADLYARAGVFAFLSEYEGFGLTPLEALSYGVPILVGDTPVAREVYGDAASFVAPRDVPAAAAALETLLFDADARAGLLAHAPAVLARYSWERAARDTLRALVDAAGE
jgi:glycosyltransferase involved in cell wall biosynthesis